MTRPHPELARRLAELVAARKRERSRAKRCPACGCTKFDRCVLAVRDAAGELLAAGVCAPAGSERWLKTCSGCLTPELRVDPAAWKWAGPDEILMEDPSAKIATAIAKAREWMETGREPAP